ncbi:hypothetical protein [Erythrobacter donghaensis]|nr:hypothetical protein [Erythrobacter donghaensis]
MAFLADSRETDPPQMLRESDAFRAIFGRLLQQGYNQRVAMTEM